MAFRAQSVFEAVGQILTGQDLAFPLGQDAGSEMIAHLLQRGGIHAHHCGPVGNIAFSCSGDEADGFRLQGQLGGEGLHAGQGLQPPQQRVVQLDLAPAALGGVDRNDG